MDPIADMFATIRNNMVAGNDRAIVRYSKVKMAILELLKKRQIVTNFSESNETGRKNIEIILNNRRTSCHIKRISKPGHRVFVKSKDIRSPLAGLGFVIISTPKGVITGTEARKIGVGGELICEVW
ncbi:30S ribosomal protein S8 [Candidatus Berkelbacteria bacterium CG08_land_8_20_14_0_20_39_8]|uniref:Small ribosomal subunit protein uS8 n=1 Tax=Candidatus Berkelbacteria bacterium CG08_land_8_20_14_0_20_39_8 TaxID=1974511 RepID=A0A2M6YC69_9BACT|nr:MAG: 30S ribosomal protein S8 [Candidatus Berkelbacteria bacterium CG08_land_8_20_14_0_20_39_8]